jgi:hypothetical protein
MDNNPNAPLLRKIYLKYKRLCGEWETIQADPKHKEHELYIKEHDIRVQIGGFEKYGGRRNVLKVPEPAPKKVTRKLLRVTPTVDDDPTPPGSPGWLAEKMDASEAAEAALKIVAKFMGNK